jgi:hypothetical protein
MGDLAQEEILAFFNKLSQYYDSPANIYLILINDMGHYLVQLPLRKIYPCEKLPFF